MNRWNVYIYIERISSYDSSINRQMPTVTQATICQQFYILRATACDGSLLSTMCCNSPTREQQQLVNILNRDFVTVISQHYHKLSVDVVVIIYLTKEVIKQLLHTRYFKDINVLTQIFYSSGTPCNRKIVYCIINFLTIFYTYNLCPRYSAHFIHVV